MIQTMSALPLQCHITQEYSTGFEVWWLWAYRVLPQVKNETSYQFQTCGSPDVEQNDFKLLILLST